MQPERFFALAASAVVTAAVIAGLVLTGGPGKGRSERMDQTRINNLNTLSGHIESYYRVHDEMPEAVTAFEAEPAYAAFTTDPRSGEPYPYEITSESSFRLCATFETDGPHELYPFARVAVTLPNNDRQLTPSAAEGPGQHCFEFTYASKD